MDRRLHSASALLQGRAPLGERPRGVVLVAEGEQVEGDERRRRLFRQHPHAGDRGVDALLQRLEVQPVAGGDDDLAVEHAPVGQFGLDRLDQFGEVAGHRLLVAAAELDLVAVPEDQ